MKNKVLIFTHIGDQSSYIISREVKALGFVPIRINKEPDRIRIIKYDFETSKLVFMINEEEYNSEEILSVFFRGGMVKTKSITPIPKDKSNIKNEIDYYLSAYQMSKIDFLSWYFESNFRCLGFNNNGMSNKMINLNIAKKNGLKIPVSYVINSKAELSKILSQHGDKKIIIKSLALNFYLYSNKDHLYIGYTKVISKSDLAEIPDFFAPSLIQEEINKKYEIRIFYLDGEVFSMAHYNQHKSETNVRDIRDYDYSKLPRVSNVSIPLSLKKKIRSFMKASSLNTGSLDMIVDKENNYVFLEVNPIGQFGYFSNVTNSFLENKIAKYLCHLN